MYLSRSGTSKFGLAIEAGLDTSYLYKLIRDEKHLPRREVVDALAAALELHPEEHARLLASLGYLPHLDAGFREVIIKIAGHWLGRA